MSHKACRHESYAGARGRWFVRRSSHSFSMMRRPTNSQPSLLEEAEAFLSLTERELAPRLPAYDVRQRLSQVRSEIEQEGTYRHTEDELLFGAQVAWRNSNRCLGRLPWRSLQILDYRSKSSPESVFRSLREYVRFATNDGRIRPTIAVFAPAHPDQGESVQILNSKLIRYAGYGEERGFKGDPDERAFTDYCEALGWRGPGSDFDLLPVVIDMPGHDVAWFEWEPGDAMEVLLTHPDLEWFSELALRWYAVPIVSNMTLGIGGLEYTAAPFNGWFMGTEVGARNLSDVGRYNVLPEIAERMHLDTDDQVALWRDRALVELNTAVLHSFSEAGVRMVDHHTASAQFMKFCRDEDRSGRSVTGDWAWLVPPLSGSATEVFHQDWDNEIRSPGFFYRDHSRLGRSCPAGGG